MSNPDRLIQELDAAGALPAEWGRVFRAVPRAGFVPDQMWVDEGAGYQPVDRAVVWPDVGHRPTCSASQPSTVLGMLNVLDVQPGHRVLEIGSGTGYTAALLAEYLGDERVTTIEVDPVLAGQAQARLTQAGYQPTVICGDGAAGHQSTAPFDRVLATATVRLGELPYPWVAQTAPGGRIVVPVRTEITSGPVVTFTVHADGTGPPPPTGHTCCGSPIPTPDPGPPPRTAGTPAPTPYANTDHAASETKRKPPTTGGHSTAHHQ